MKLFLPWRNTSGGEFKDNMLWNKMSFIGLNLIMSRNKTAEMSETQQLISKVIYNFFRMTGSDDKGSDP